MEANGTISTRGLKPDATHYCELIFDVNSTYIDNHGGYEFVKQFYADAYKAAVQIVGGEQYILSAVMHADEINRAMTEAIGREVYHYHLHVVYVPVVEKQILWSKRCKDKEKQAAHGYMMDVENRRPHRSIKTAGRSRKGNALPYIDVSRRDVSAWAHLLFFALNLPVRGFPNLVIGLWSMTRYRRFASSTGAFVVVPKKTKNPNPSPIGNRFGFLLFRGPDRIRTDDPHNANVVRSQLRYKPITIFFDLIIIAPRGTDVKIFHGKNEKIPQNHNVYPD